MLAYRRTIGGVGPIVFECETGVASGPACLQWTDRPKDGYILGVWFVYTVRKRHTFASGKWKMGRGVAG
jgi:hypothetical protein